MKTNEMIRDSIQFAVGLLASMTKDMSSDELHWNPPGTAHSVAATYAHAALSSDWQIHSLFEGSTPRYETDWAGKTGVNNPSMMQTLEWAQTIQVDMPQFQEYAETIFSEVLDYCDNLSDQDMARPIDMSIIGVGEKTLAWCLSTVVAGHLNQLAGEIAAVKGMQGLTGYS